MENKETPELYHCRALDTAICNGAQLSANMHFHALRELEDSGELKCLTPSIMALLQACIPTIRGTLDSQQQFEYHVRAMKDALELRMFVETKYHLTRVIELAKELNISRNKNVYSLISSAISSISDFMMDIHKTPVIPTSEPNG